MVDICQQLEHPTVQGIVDGLMNLYIFVAGGMLLDGLLVYLTFETTAFGMWHIQELCILNTQHYYILHNPQNKRIRLTYLLTYSMVQSPS